MYITLDMVHAQQKAIHEHLFPEEQGKELSTFHQTTLALVGDHEAEKTWMAREICEYSPVVRNPNYVCEEDIVSTVKNMLPQGQENSMKIFINQAISMPEYIANNLGDDQVSRVDLVMDKEAATITTYMIRDFLLKKGFFHEIFPILITDKSYLYEEIGSQMRRIDTSDDGKNYDRRRCMLLILHDVLSSRTRSLTSSQEVSHALIPERMEKVIEIKPFSGVEFDKILSDKEATLISSVKMLFDKFFSTQLPAAVAMMIAEVNKIIKQNHSRIPMLENHMRKAANYKEADGQEKIISEVMQYLYDMLPSDNIVTLINLLKHEGSPLSKLRVLVLRGCHMLESIDHVKKMESLEMLEICGARSLKEIPDEVFGKMPKLRSLHLSALPVKYLPSSFSELTELRWLILRDCSCLEEVPSLKAFKSLQLVDISGACSLAKFEDKKVDSPVEINPEALTYLSLGGCDQLNELFTLKTCSGLQILDLSDNNSLRETSIDFLATQGLRILDMSKTKSVVYVPILATLLDLSGLIFPISCSDEIEKIDFANLKCLRHLNLSNTKIRRLQSLCGLGSLGKLLLRDCQFLKELPQMEELDRLEMLDLSGACSLRKIRDPKHLSDLFRCLRHLNLSRTKVKNLPSLSYHGALCELLLRDCQLLEQLPYMKELRTLEKLDLSGCCLLKEIPDGESLSQMRNLRQLLLSDCTNLRKLPVLGALEKLEVLNLSGCSAVTGIADLSFNRITSLRQLNLSETNIEVLPASLSKLVNLHQLLLRDCINLEELPSLESLMNLQQLDLRGAISLRKTVAKFLEKMTKLRFLDLSNTRLILPRMLGTNLSLLSLSNCSSLNYVPLNQLEKLIHLETLDLRGIKVRDFPYWIANLIHLKSLYLPDLNEIPQLDWGRIKRLPDVLNWDECGMFANFDLHTSTRCPSLTINSTKIFHYLLDKDANIWDKCFEGFHISVCSSSNISGEDRLFFCSGDESSSLQEIHFKSLSCPKEQGEGSVEISGHDEEFPAGVEEVLKREVYIFLTRNKFIKHLSDIGKDNMLAMKGLWLDGCANIESIFSENQDIIKMDQSFEILWVSNLVNLLPENLEFLRIKFCCRLKYVFQPDCADFALHKLRELHLIELPELVSIGIILYSIQSINIRNCPSLISSDCEIIFEQTVSQSHEVISCNYYYTFYWLLLSASLTSRSSGLQK
ncbi:hypothetical protein FEM48_Zijuj06G0187000 [Ziziphus jujuba var. spinosa]|uniref:Disease resistance protein At4g19050 n=1 Tax=Ziziphus jujuba var. spinosa TaxID=714518 RepID=A0A978VAZ4_ZIZJJ|nr:hypothetical protein FEM48_Zijuj06G0187000 [Ziziphus jujuba var. spinosa]